MENVLFAMRNVVDSAQAFVRKHRDKNYKVVRFSNSVDFHNFRILSDRWNRISFLCQHLRSSLPVRVVYKK